MEKQFRSSVFEALQRTGRFTAFMGAHFSAVDLDSAIRFGNVPGPFKGARVPVAYSKWARRFDRIRLCLPGIKEIACRIDNNRH